jgi:hypothetical protein
MRASLIAVIFRVLAFGAALFGLAPVAAAHSRAGRYIVRVRNVVVESGGANLPEGFTERAKLLLIDELKKHDAFTLEWPAGLPDQGQELGEALRKRKLRAFEVTLKILDVKSALDPPPPGKQYRIIKRGIKLSIFGDTLPEKVLAIGGDGESSVAAEVGKQADIGKEGGNLLAEATKEAVRQAVEMTLNKLDLADKPQKVAPKKK